MSCDKHAGAGRSAGVCTPQPKVLVLVMALHSAPAKQFFLPYVVS